MTLPEDSYIQYRNCPNCRKKISFWGNTLEEHYANIRARKPLRTCQQCNFIYDLKQTNKFLEFENIIKLRIIEQDRDETQQLFSTFYSCAPGKYESLYEIPFYTLSEILAFENMQWIENHGTGMYPDPHIASFIPAQQPANHHFYMFQSWQSLYWDPQQELFLVGPDDGGVIILSKDYPD